eukprot:g18151.t1
MMSRKPVTSKKPLSLSCMINSLAVATTSTKFLLSVVIAVWFVVISVCFVVFRAPHKKFRKNPAYLWRRSTHNPMTPLMSKGISILTRPCNAPERGKGAPAAALPTFPSVAPAPTFLARPLLDPSSPKTTSSTTPASSVGTPSRAENTSGPSATSSTMHPSSPVSPAVPNHPPPEPDQTPYTTRPRRGGSSGHQNLCVLGIFLRYLSLSVGHDLPTCSCPVVALQLRPIALAALIPLVALANFRLPRLLSFRRPLRSRPTPAMDWAVFTNCICSVTLTVHDFCTCYQCYGKPASNSGKSPKMLVPSKHKRQIDCGRTKRQSLQFNFASDLFLLVVSCSVWRMAKGKTWRCSKCGCRNTMPYVECSNCFPAAIMEHFCRLFGLRSGVYYCKS